MLYRMNDGTLPIPDHWRDDTVNVFTISETEGTNLVISRQRVSPELSVSDFLNQQINSFDENLKEYKKLGKQSVDIDGGTGVSVEYTFKSPEGVMHQLTTMVIKDELFISMTFTHPRAMTDNQKAEFLKIVHQYKFSASSDNHVE